MKTIVINASPRKRLNTAQIMKSACEGAESVGADVEYIDLYDIDLKGCMSCLICKSKKTENVKCYWRDDLSPIIEKILQADTLLIGSPIYFGKVTSHFRALMERLIFCVLSYDDYSSYYEGKLNVGLFYTMNAPEEIYKESYEENLKENEDLFNLLNANVITYPVFNTLQVKDYSKYRMSAFNEEDKKDFHENQFPKDLQEAFRIGAKLSKNLKLYY